MHGRRRSSIALCRTTTSSPHGEQLHCFPVAGAGAAACCGYYSSVDAAAGADPVRGLHRGLGQQQRPHHLDGALQLRALRPGLPAGPQRHREVQQRQDRRRHPRHKHGPETVRAGVPGHGAQRLGSPHRRQLRLRRLRLRPPHVRARVGSEHGRPAGHVQGVQGQAEEHRRRPASRLHRVDEPVPGGHRLGRPGQHLLHHALPARLRPRVLHPVHRPVRHRLHQEAVRHGRAAAEHRGRAADRVHAVAADARRRPRQGVRRPLQPGRRAVQRGAGEGDQAAQRLRGAAGVGAQVHRPLHAAARHDAAAGSIRIRGGQPRVLRHGAVRGHAHLQQLHGGRLRRPEQVPLLGHIPSHGDWLQHPHGKDHRSLRIVVIRDATKMMETFGHHIYIDENM